jgi:hypothetical protein
MSIARSPIAWLVPEIEAHYHKGNSISMITYIKSGSADKDLGMGGTVTPKITLIQPEPHINAIKVEVVNGSNGAFRFSDLVMTMARQSATFESTIDLHTEWNVNGDIYQTIAITPGPSIWEVVLRRKTTAPVTP